MAAVPPLPRSFEEAARLHYEVEAELERVCQSPHFRSSRRSCEFLRYVVRVALDGRTDSLKERSIGIDLLGRDASYDPSSDATVRVRANEVRKRLITYYGSAPVAGAFRISLPTGSYVPRFLPAAAAPVITLAEPPNLTNATGPAAPKALTIPALSGLVLMRPAFIALLVCVLLLRHQLESREDYLRFWDQVLAGRSTVLLSVAPEDRDRLASGLYPLVWIAGHYGVETAVDAAPVAGVSPAAIAAIRISTSSPAAWQTEGRLRWLLDAGGPGTLTDRAGSASAMPAPHAALLTVLPEDRSTLYAQGTDNDALRHLCEELTTGGRFPAGLLKATASEGAAQLLVRPDGTGRWTSEIWVQQP